MSAADDIARLLAAGMIRQDLASCARAFEEHLAEAGFGGGYQRDRRGCSIDPWWLWERRDPGRNVASVTAEVTYLEQDDRVSLTWLKRVALGDGRVDVEVGSARGEDASRALPPRLVEVLAVVARGDGEVADIVGRPT